MFQAQTSRGALETFTIKYYCCKVLFLFGGFILDVCQLIKHSVHVEKSNVSGVVCAQLNVCVVCMSFFVLFFCVCVCVREREYVCVCVCVCVRVC